MFTKKNITKAYLLAIAALWCSYGFAQKPEKDNLSYLYNAEAPVQCASRVAVSEAEATIFLQIRISPEIKSEVTIRYREMAAYESEDILQEGTLTESEHLIKKEDHFSYYRFTVPATQPTAFVFVYVQHNEYTLRFDVPIKTEQDFPPTDLLVMQPDEDVPYFNDYIEAGQPFRIVSWYGKDSTEHKAVAEGWAEVGLPIT